MLEHPEQLRASHSAEKAHNAGVNATLGQSRALQFATKEPQADQCADGNHDAKARDLELTDAKDDGIDGRLLSSLSYALECHPPEPERIADDRDGAERHRRARDHRAEQQAEERIQHARRNRHAEHVVDKRKEQVLPDVASSLPG